MNGFPARLLLAVLILAVCCLGGSDRLAWAVAQLGTWPGFALLFPTMVLVVLGQMTRSLRLHFALSGFRPPLRETVRMQFTAATLGNATIAMVQEASLLGLYFLERRHHQDQPRPILLPVALAVMVIRIFDFLVILPLIFLMAPVLSPYHVFLIVTALVITTALLAFPLIIERLERHALRNYHGGFGVFIVGHAAAARRIFQRMKITKPDTIFLVVVLTLVGWGCELLALMWLSQSGIIHACHLLVSRISGPPLGDNDARAWYGCVLVALGAASVAMTLATNRGWMPAWTQQSWAGRTTREPAKP